jgi:hypothetical protein
MQVPPQLASVQQRWPQARYKLLCGQWLQNPWTQNPEQHDQ